MSNALAHAAECLVDLDAKLLKSLSILREAAIVMSVESRILFFNRAAEKLFGYRSKDVLGKPIEILMGSPHKENHSYYVQRYVATGKVFVFFCLCVNF